MSETRHEKVKKAMYIAVYNKLMGELSELEAREVILTNVPAYITSKEHDHAEHIQELRDIIVRKVELKDAIKDVRSVYFTQSMPQGHVKDEKTNSNS